jgi:hypothetical protein
VQLSILGEAFDSRDLAAFGAEGRNDTALDRDPSSQTVHAPQSPASHPFLTPNQPSSRRKVRKHWPAAGSLVNVLPLT